MALASGAALLILILLGGILVVRALRYGVATSAVPSSATAPDVDQDAASGRLAQTLRCQTISGPDPEAINREPFDRLHQTLRESFPLIHEHLEREVIGELSLLYTWSGQEPELRPILLMAHQDVVPVEPGTEKDWTHPPFGGEIAEGFIWGRGALDMKSALTGIFEAVEILLKEGYQPRRTLYIALGHDEEVGGFNGNARIAALLKERGERLEYVVDEGGLIAHGVIPGVRDPVALVGVAEKGFVNLILTARGEGGHSAMPPRRSAVTILARALLRLERSPFPAHLGFIDGMFKHLGRRLPFAQRLLFANLRIFSPVIARLLARNPKVNSNLRTTLAPTMLRGGIKENVLATEVSAVVNVRVFPGDTIAGTTDRMLRIIRDERVRITPTPGTEPSPASPTEGPAFDLLRRTILETAPDVAVAPYLVVGATDSRHYAGLTRHIFRFLFARLDSRDIQRLHGTDERISVEDYIDAVTFYHRLIVNSDSL